MVPSRPVPKEGNGGFTLLELLISATLSSIILGLLFYLLNLSLDQWRSQTDGQVNSVEARTALTYLEEDLKAIVVRNHGDAEWLRVQNLSVSEIGEMPWLTFLTRPTDADKSESGDVCAVSYRVEKKSAFGGREPVHGLYRMVLSPKETAAFIGTDDMNADFWSARESETVSLDRFLAAYVVDFDLSFRVRDPEGSFHTIEPSAEIRAAGELTIEANSGQSTSVPDGSVLASVEIRLTVVNLGAQQILNAKTLSIDEIKTRYGKSYLSVVEIPEPSF